MAAANRAASSSLLERSQGRAIDVKAKKEDYKMQLRRFDNKK